MTTIVFDCETSGFPDKPRGFYNYYNPKMTKYYDSSRCLELSWFVLSTETNNIKEKKSFLLLHDGVFPENNPSAFKVHKISNQMYKEEGKDPKEVLREFAKDLAQADLLVGHNLQFDKHVVLSELYRYGLEKEAEELRDIPTLCTMQTTTDICKIPNPHPYYGGYKVPRLTELYEYLFHKNPNQQHRAEDDVRITVECFSELCKRGCYEFTDS